MSPFIEQFVLSLEDIRALAQEHGLEITAHERPLPPGRTRVASKPSVEVVIHFKEENAPAWKAIMSVPTLIPVAVYGTRIVTGSGATDGRLKAAYAEILEEVNTTRARHGLFPIRR